MSELIKDPNQDLVTKGLVKQMGDEIQSALNFAFSNPYYNQTDPEFGDYDTGVQNAPITIYFPKNGQYPLPRPITSGSRTNHQKQMALFFSNKANFNTLLPLPEDRFKLLKGPVQNHFTPEMVFYMNVLYENTVRHVGSRDPKQKFSITSGFRSIEYNKGIGAKSSGVASWSAHSGGIAADIWGFNKSDMIKILDAAYEIGFGGLGLYGSFCHVDISGRSFWTSYKGPHK